MATLHIHLDESGDWNFTPKSPSRYLILTMAWTYDPLPLATDLTSLRFSIIKAGDVIESFHASEDKQAVRDLVVAAMVRRKTWSFASVVLEKRKINPVLYDAHRFYPTFAGALLRFVLKGSALQPGTHKVLVFADTLPMIKSKREGVLKAMKQTCASCLPKSVEHHVLSYRRESNKWLQVADYCCWAVARKWERSDTRTYIQLLSRLDRSELVITDRGDGRTYY